MPILGDSVLTIDLLSPYNTSIKSSIDVETLGGQIFTIYDANLPGELSFSYLFDNSNLSYKESNMF